MNRITKYMSLCVTAALSFGFASCDDTKDNDMFTMAPTADVPIYFAVSESGEPETIGLGLEDETWTYTVYRNSLDAPSSAVLEWSGDTEVFDLPSSVEFEEDAIMAEIEFGVNPADMEPGKEYTLKVTLPEYPSTTVCSNYIENIFMYEPMTPWAPFAYDAALGRDGLGSYKFSLYVSGTEYPVYVEYRQSELNEKKLEYRFYWLKEGVNPDDADIKNTEQWEEFLNFKSFDGGETFTVPVQATYWTYGSYGTVYVSDMYTYLGEEDEDFGPSYFDEETGTFYLDLIYYVNAGYLAYGYETCTMNGFLDTNDYTINLSDLGPLTMNGSLYSIINLTWTDAVEYVLYSVVYTSSLMDDGEMSETLLEELVNKIAEEEVPYTYVQSQGNQALQMPYSGEYTLVAVGLREENDGTLGVKTYSTVNFTFDLGSPNAEWKDMGYVEYTDGYICSLFGVEPLTYYVGIQESDGFSGLYRLVDPYGVDYPFNEPGDWDASVTSYLYFDISNPNCAYVEYSPQTIDWVGGSPITCYSWAAYYMDYNDYTEDEVIAEELNGTYSDKKLTFPYSSLAAVLGGRIYSTNYVWDWNEVDEDGYPTDDLKDEEGNYVAPFLIDFNTLTTNPVAQGSTKTAKGTVRMLRNVASTRSDSVDGITLPKHAKLVKYNSKSLNSSDRKPYRTELSNKPLKRAVK